MSAMHHFEEMGVSLCVISERYAFDYNAGKSFSLQLLTTVSQKNALQKPLDTGIEPIGSVDPQLSTNLPVLQNLKMTQKKSQHTNR